MKVSVIASENPFMFFTTKSYSFTFICTATSSWVFHIITYLYVIPLDNFFFFLKTMPLSSNVVCHRAESQTTNQSMGRACLYCHRSLPDVEKTELITYREPNWNQLLKTMKSVHSCISPICGEGRCHSLSYCGPLFNQSALDLHFHHSGCVTCCRVFGGLQCKHICIRWIPLSIASAQTNNYPNRAELCHKLSIKVCLFVFYQKMSLSHNYQVTTNLKKIANLCQLNAFLGWAV